MDYYQDIIKQLLEGKPKTRDQVQKLKIQLCRKYKMDKLPSNAEILAYVSEEDMDELEPLLRTKPVRTISGVAVVAVMTSPHDCPHGKCRFCPGGVENGTAQSYTGREPAALRAATWNFDPHDQVKSRLEQLEAIGHPTDKVDLIIMGGTFTARDVEFQTDFVKGCFDAMNGEPSETLAAAQTFNETARHRCIGMTVETRPDHFYETQVDLALDMGATRVELGVQTLNDNALKAMERGHGSSESAKATQITRDAGMKVGYHMMPGLPGETPESDLATFDKLFSDEKFMPDMLKLYPVLVIGGTKLHEMWKAGDYEPYSQDILVNLLADVKEKLPKWTRIQRIQRDIPVQLIEAGGKKSHLRELVQWELEARGTKCNCIRCREAGHNYLKGKEPGDIELLTEEYQASGGKEYFISFEDPEKNILIGFVRMRIPSENAHRPEMENTAIIRELRTVSQQLPISERGDSWQHRGFGEKMINRCVELAQENGCEKILVTSGVGAREYYRKLDWEREGPYMARQL
ncbi:MAG: tRNA uridine(34) 5-carboxymethylaminomethyl modification radical SAM/GNAT enzyme Elp3 [Thermoplasmata archaeon]|nr:tRNA uridine(34) 5-carboxymethylaminomethyl modification radical SAM/GNAT enzyme Elp3 [Thermoplasmata archaeon]